MGTELATLDDELKEIQSQEKTLKNDLHVNGVILATFWTIMMLFFTTLGASLSHDTAATFNDHAEPIPDTVKKIDHSTYLLQPGSSVKASDICHPYSQGKESEYTATKIADQTMVVCGVSQTWNVGDDVFRQTGSVFPNVAHAVSSDAYQILCGLCTLIALAVPFGLYAPEKRRLVRAKRFKLKEIQAATDITEKALTRAFVEGDINQQQYEHRLHQLAKGHQLPADFIPVAADIVDGVQHSVHAAKDVPVSAAEETKRADTADYVLPIGNENFD